MPFRFIRRKTARKASRNTVASSSGFPGLTRYGKYRSYKNTVNKPAWSAPGWGMMLRKAPFPPRINRTMTYEQFYAYQNGDVTTFGVENVFRLNSIFDPDKTAAGHQPYGFDQLENIYKSYRVNAVTIKITATDPSADGCVVGALITPPGSTNVLFGKSINQMGEKPWCAMLNINNTGSQERTMTKYFRISDLAGLTNLQFDANDSDYSSAIGTNPARQPLLHIAVAEYGGGLASTKSVQVKVALTFHVMLWDEAIFDQS